MTDVRNTSTFKFKNNNPHAESAPDQQQSTFEAADCELPLEGSAPDDSLTGSNIFAFILGRHPVFVDSNGTPYIGIVDEGNPQALQIGRKPANIYLRQLCAAQSGNRLKPNDLKTINEELTEYAELSGDVREVFYRVARIENGIELDVGDNRHTRIRITPGKVELIMNGSETFFHRTPGMRSFALPADRGDLALLDKYLNLHPADRMLLKAYLTYTLAHAKVSETNYVILVLQGDQGSGKSLLCRLIQWLTDPNTVGVRTFPHNATDLAIAAQNGHLLMFDNLRRITSAMADKLCIAATGGSLAGRKLYTDGEQHVLWLHVALVLNGIYDFVDQPDFAQRCLHLHLLAIDEKHRRSESEILQDFRADLPRIFRGILDLIAEIMAHLPSVEVTNPERMIEFVRWLAAMEKVYGMPPGVLQAQYSSALNEGMLDSLQENPLAVAIMAFAENLSEDEWKGTPTELLQVLNFPSGARSRDWPQNAIALSKRLKPLQEALRRQKFDVQWGVRGEKRRITITRMRD